VSPRHIPQILAGKRTYANAGAAFHRPSCAARRWPIARGGGAGDFVLLDLKLEGGRLTATFNGAARRAEGRAPLLLERVVVYGASRAPAKVAAQQGAGPSRDVEFVFDKDAKAPRPRLHATRSLLCSRAHHACGPRAGPLSRRRGGSALSAERLAWGQVLILRKPNVDMEKEWSISM
jgi:hypothetical protein